MVLSCIGFTYILIIGIYSGSYWNLIWSIIYGLTLVLLHTSSTLYHGTINIDLKKKFRLMDQSCIYLLIAGTYTPIALINLYGVFGLSIFAMIWSLSILGIYLKINNIQPFPKFEVLLCLFMGWFALVGIKELTNNMDINGVLLIIAGGLFFSIGIISFYFFIQNESCA